MTNVLFGQILFWLVTRNYFLHLCSFSIHSVCCSFMAMTNQGVIKAVTVYPCNKMNSHNRHGTTGCLSESKETYSSKDETPWAPAVC